MFQKRDALTVYVEGTNKKLDVLRNLHRLGETVVLKFPHLELQSCILLLIIALDTHMGLG